jgi:site-specific DNA-cytosine methylase
VSKKIRGLAWVIVKWAKLVRPRVIFLENVEEFQTWGPLGPDDRPCPQRKGRTFQRWKRSLENLGYTVDFREDRACDFGAPTIRKRLFLVARCDGQPIVFPEPTHGAPDSLPVKAKKLKPWRTAAECIDWSIPAFYLKCDLANFFVGIDKHVVFEQLARKIHEPWWLWLAKTILFHDPREDVELRGDAHRLALVPPHKSLFNAAADTGLPIGNLSSQFFANVHLDALDKFCKHQVRARHYIRYVDDFILLHRSREWLQGAHEKIRAFLPQRLGARLNDSKTIIQPVDRGVDFVGHVVKPWRRTTRRRTLANAVHRLRWMPADDVFKAGNSYLGLARQASHSKHEQALIAKVLLWRGHAVGRTVDDGFARAFRRSNG